VRNTDPCGKPLAVPLNPKPTRGDLESALRYELVVDVTDESVLDPYVLVGVAE
jgi:hypothetical protein